ncbi:MAG: carboxypeptidase-like regulatory domain-containing protein [Cyclobacteriaceae bacterium]|nr:carboxypeptidase-like regulatory domain-containing protein [Cyclobacteriaceae bacterium]
MVDKNKGLVVRKFVFVLFWMMVQVLMAQEGERKVIQFTGVVFISDSSMVVPGVHVYVPKGGRGTTTNPYGFFSMPVLEGDSVIFSAVSLERLHYIVPKHDADNSLKLLVYMKEDITYLEEVEIFPYPSEATFKAAVLASELPNQKDLDALNEWLNPVSLQQMSRDLPNSAYWNSRYFMQEQMDAQMYRGQLRPNPLLNPFAWASFIRSLKNSR